MPAFLKNPKFIGAAILVAWVIYVVTANFQLPPIGIHLLPYAQLQFNVSAVIVAAAIFGSLVTLGVQFFWKRWRTSKPASELSPAPGESSKTVA